MSTGVSASLTASSTRGLSASFRISGVIVMVLLSPVILIVIRLGDAGLGVGSK
jgi:hypothetical protein